MIWLVCARGSGLFSEFSDVFPGAFAWRCGTGDGELIVSLEMLCKRA
jgi:hypothetical protein